MKIALVLCALTMVFRGDVPLPEWYRRHPVPPIPPIEFPETERVVALRKTAVEIYVTGPLADVEVIQHFHNPTNDPVDVLYTFPLPGNAAVRQVEAVIGSRILKAQLRELEEARRIYEEAQAAGHGALLLEAPRENIFRTRIANVPPRSDIAVRIRYQQILSHGAEYELRFPTVVAPRYTPRGQADAEIFQLPYKPDALPGHTIDISVEIDAGDIESISSPSHPITIKSRDHVTDVSLAKQNEIPNRDFILKWRPRNPAGAATLWSEERSFVLTATAPEQSADASDNEIVFILDTSGSMQGEKFAAATRALKGLIRALGPRDSIRIIEFDNSFSELAPDALRWSQATLDRADEWIDQLQADGGTEILKPLSHALRLASDRERDRIIVLLTDGQVGNEEQILAEVSARVGRTRIFTLGIDYAVNDEMLRSIARVGKGVSMLITPDEDVEGAVLSLKNKFAGPVVTDLELKFPGVTFPKDLPDLFADEPLVIFGRAHETIPETVVITGRCAGRAWSLSLAPRRAKADVIGAVAEKEIEALTDEMRGRENDRARNEIVELSIRHNVISPFTAFVLVDQRNEPTETGRARDVVVPVAYPHGWRMPAPSPRAVTGAMRLMRSPMVAMEAAAVPPPTTISADDLVVRYLLRTQRANGTWADDARTTALAAIGLRGQGGEQLNRALDALRRVDIGGLDPLTAALVARALGKNPVVPDRGSVPQVDRMVWDAIFGGAAARRSVKDLLSVGVVSSGASAGAVRVTGLDELLAAALLAAAGGI